MVSTQKLIQMVYDYVLTDNMKAQNEQLNLTNQGLAAAKTLPRRPEQFKNRKNRCPHRSVVVFFLGGGKGGGVGWRRGGFEECRKSKVPFNNNDHDKVNHRKISFYASHVGKNVLENTDAKFFLVSYTDAK